jgi:hypothetical protein
MVHYLSALAGLGAKGRFMTIARVLCLFRAHEPNRSNVEWKDNRFVGKCKRCGKPIHRIATRKWRPYSGDPA